MAHVYISAVIAAPIDEVWAVARDFNGHAEWHPFIAESHIEDGLASDTVGCVRNFTLGNGGHLRERLLALSDLDHHFTYSILESPMPIPRLSRELRPQADHRRRPHLRGMERALRGRAGG